MVNIPKKILIVRTDRLGDVILSTPVISNLKIAFPKAHIAFMCRPYTEQALVGNPHLDEVIVYDKYGKDKGFFSTIKFSFFLRKKKFDWVIVLHPTNRAHLLAFLAGIPVRIGWDKDFGFLLTKKLCHTKSQGKKHELDYSLDVLKSLDVSIKEKGTYFPLNKKAENTVGKLLKSKGLGSEDKFVVIHPSASCVSKRWPIEYFKELIELLKKSFSLKIVVVTSESEKAFAQELAGNTEVIDFRGRLDISELGVLLKKAALFISNDSGPVHIAASLDTPVISIFGRKDPGLSSTRWRPQGAKSYYVHKDVGCRVCLAHDCQKGFLCLKDIKPQELFEMIVKILKGDEDDK